MKKAGAWVNYVVMGVLILMSAVYIYFRYYLDAAIWALLAIAFLSAGRIQNPDGARVRLWTRLMYGATIAAGAIFVFQIIKDRI